MRKLIAALSAVGLGLASLAAVAPTAGAAPPPGATVTASPTPSDDLPNPLEEKRRELRQTALFVAVAVWFQVIALRRRDPITRRAAEHAAGLVAAFLASPALSSSRDTIATPRFARFSLPPV